MIDPSTIIVPLSSGLTLSGLVAALVIAVLLTRERWGSRSRIIGWIGEHIMVLLLLIALAGTLGSLYFSEIVEWVPCKLCWYQRIFLYPQVLLLGLALWRRDRGILPYILLLNAAGAAIALWHYGEQLYAVLHPADPSVPCDITGISCASAPFYGFGFITIPLMALVAFVLSMLGALCAMVRSRDR